MRPETSTNTILEALHVFINTHMTLFRTLLDSSQGSVASADITPKSWSHTSVFCYSNSQATSPKFFLVTYNCLPNHSKLNKFKQEGQFSLY